MKTSRLQVLLAFLVVFLSVSVGASAERAAPVEKAPEPVGGDAQDEGNLFAVSGSIDVRVQQSSDDAEEQTVDGSVRTKGGDLELGEDVLGPQIVGLRFSNVPIPQGATITQAYLEFTATQADDQPTNVTIRGQASDYADPFSSAEQDISSRPKTVASVPWSGVPPWPIEGGVHQSPDLTSIVQEVVNRGGWTPSSALVFIITGTGRRTAWSYDGDATKAPRLVVSFAGQATCHRLTTSVNPPGTGQVTVEPGPNCPGGQYIAGTQVELTATPTAMDYAFTGWSGSASGSANPLTLVIDGDKAVTANFAQRACVRLTTNVVPPLPIDQAKIDVTPGPNCGGGKYVPGTEVQLQAKSTSQYRFVGWSGDVTGIENPVMLVLDGNKSVTATFEQSAFRLFLPAIRRR